jgi:hypothetical protein
MRDSARPPYLDVLESGMRESAPTAKNEHRFARDHVLA